MHGWVMIYIINVFMPERNYTWKFLCCHIIVGWHVIHIFIERPSQFVMYKFVQEFKGTVSRDE